MIDNPVNNNKWFNVPKSHWWQLHSKKVKAGWPFKHAGLYCYFCANCESIVEYGVPCPVCLMEEMDRKKKKNE